MSRLAVYHGGTEVQSIEGDSVDCIVSIFNMSQLGDNNQKVKEAKDVINLLNPLAKFADNLTFRIYAGSKVIDVPMTFVLTLANLLTNAKGFGVSKNEDVSTESLASLAEILENKPKK